MGEKKLLLYETHSGRRIAKLIDIFEKYRSDYRIDTKILKREEKKIVYRIYAYVDKQTETYIREEVKELYKPFAASLSF